MNRFFRNLFSSTLGKKYLMAATGFLMILFVIAHMVGNLQYFLGPESINRYGDFLQTNVELLWPARIGLLIIIFVHIWAAITLTAANRAARPVAYQSWQPTAASYASRTMMMSGLIILAFIIYHIMHFTVMVESINLTGKNFVPLKDSFGRHDIYTMMTIGFSNGWVCLFYLVGVGLLCFHLSHGASAMWQSMGWKKRSYGPFLDRLAIVGSILLFAGYASIPVSIYL